MAPQRYRRLSGVSWQVIPEILGALLSHKDPAKSGRAMRAMLKMRKIHI